MLIRLIEDHTDGDRDARLREVIEGRLGDKASTEQQDPIEVYGKYRVNIQCLPEDALLLGRHCESII